MVSHGSRALSGWSGHIWTTCSDWGFSACENSTTKSDHSMGYDPNLSISYKLKIIEGLEMETLWSVKFVKKGWFVH